MFQAIFLLLRFSTSVKCYGYARQCWCLVVCGVVLVLQGQAVQSALVWNGRKLLLFNRFCTICSYRLCSGVKSPSFH